MTDVVLPIATGVLSVLGFLCAVACYSLRGFSRSRLEEICRRRGREARFGVILREHERVLLAVELCLAIVAVLLVASWMAWWRLIPPLPGVAASGAALAARF
ncbi:MAG TPA: hypothetical protein VML55_14730, partial [Planctomycetaceae bacterium]|nr:hypothetical protein [Planctomycetaceae bacterium]